MQCNINGFHFYDKGGNALGNKSLQIDVFEVLCVKSLSFSSYFL